MILTQAQKTALKAHIDANTATVETPQGTVQIKDVPKTADTYDEVSAWYNGLLSPTYKVWRTLLNLHDFVEQPDLDSDGVTPTNFAGGGGTGSLIDRSQGERDVFINVIWNSTLNGRPYLANIRVMVFDIFSGAAALAAQNRKHYWARGQRACTRFEHALRVQTVGGPTHSATNGNNPAGQTGTRGAWTNPDTLGLGADGVPLDGPVSKTILLDAALNG